ncbi:MAG: DUF190 domain-containing protein [Acidihalobacter sp.]|uniref:DUF190 domain-containing protein n=1 Tax=Acidihalobacter sp. TaxID=1872108 RepID=UPI00307D2569
MPAAKLVRIYFKEGDKTDEHHSLMRELFQLLHDEHRVRGVTVFRGVAGFGDHGIVQAEDLLGLNVHLPLVLELFDAPDVVDTVLPLLCERVPAKHIVCWDVEVVDA